MSLAPTTMSYRGKWLSIAPNIIRVVLAVCIHKQKRLPAGGPNSCFHGSAVADVICMPANDGTGRFSKTIGPIRRSIINHDDFKIRVFGFQLRISAPIVIGFIISRNNYGNIRAH